MSDLRWLDTGDNVARVEDHTPENAGPECKPNCVAHYVWPLRLVLPGKPTIIRSLKDGE